MLGTFTDNLRAVLPYWWVLLVGGAMAFSDLFKWHLPDGKEFKLPHWTRVGLSVGALVIAQFLAYKDQSRNLSKVIEEKRDSDSVNGHLALELNQEKQTTVRLEQQVEDLRRNQSRSESPNSLRRRTIKLADEVYDFAMDRQRNHPPYAYPNPQDDEERKRVVATCMKYDQETMDNYNHQFKDRMIGIVAEYKAKGVNIGFLEATAQRGPTVGGMGDELQQFRDLAYHVDASGNRIDLR